MMGKRTLGIGPKSAKAGDMVTVFLGCDSAMILGPTGVRDEYRLVREANCDGIWDGEALLGPLPSNFAFVDKNSENMKAYYAAFMNYETRNLQFKDPRLTNVPLPAGWSIYHEPKDEERIWFQDEKSGVILARDHDPRMTPESLRARGIPIQTFNLV